MNNGTPSPARAHEAKVPHDAEKRSIESGIARRFLDAYNRITCSTFLIAEHGDAPDFRLDNALGEQFALEVALVGDTDGTIPWLLGRGPDPLEAPGAPPSISLAEHVAVQVLVRLEAKSRMDYGINAALVLASVGGIPWDFKLVFEDLVKNCPAKAAQIFTRGVWTLSEGNELLRLV